MPNNTVKSFADKSGKDEAEVERLWTKATELVNQKYPDVKEDRHYALVTGILKKMLKINEEFAVGVADSGMNAGVPESGAGKGEYAPKMGKPLKRKNPKLIIDYLRKKLRTEE